MIKGSIEFSFCLLISLVPYSDTVRWWLGTVGLLNNLTNNNKIYFIMWNVTRLFSLSLCLFLSLCLSVSLCFSCPSFLLSFILYSVYSAFSVTKVNKNHTTHSTQTNVYDGGSSGGGSYRMFYNVLNLWRQYGQTWFPIFLSIATFEKWNSFAILCYECFRFDFKNKIWNKN